MKKKKVFVKPAIVAQGSKPRGDTGCTNNCQGK